MNREHINPPAHINPLVWHQATGHARQICAGIFRDGGAPDDALKAYGLGADLSADDWSKAVGLIAETICLSGAMKRAA